MADLARPGLSTRAKLWIGFGTLTALLAAFCLAVLHDLRAVERDLYEQAEVARPRSAATRQMEINLLGFALAVRSFLHLRDHRFVQEAKRKAQELDRSIVQYAELARTSRQQELASRFRSLWHEYRALGERLMARAEVSEAEGHELLNRRLALEKLVGEEILLEARQTYDETKTATSSRLRALMRLAVFLLAFGLVVAAVTGVAVSRSILRHERALQSSSGSGS